MMEPNPAFEPTARKRQAAVDVDHIKALADGGEPYDEANLRSLCHPCHSRITRAWQ